MRQMSCPFLILLAVLLSGWIFSSCKDSNDIISADRSLNLSFSKDTVRFDTVFTSIKTATKRVLIYNRNKKAVNIDAIQLMGGSNSFFRINVDGFSGNQTNIELRGQDSMYVFIELTIDPQNENSPVFIEDSIRFVTNGNARYLRLEAYGQDVHIWKEKTISSDTTINSERPFLIYDTLTIAKGANLTISPGTRLYFHNKAGISVKGRISAEGTPSQPVVFRGDRTDNLFSGISYDTGVTGQWNGITIDSLSYNNVFRNVRIRNSVDGIIFLQSQSDKKKATLTNTVVHSVAGNGITATNCNMDFFNCQITNAKETCVRLVGGKYTFLHCTLANYFFTANESRAAGSKTLYISNVLGKALIPLDECSFTNCIIAGSGYDEIGIYNLLDGIAQTPFNHLFTRCLIKANSSDDANFVRTIWNKDPQFINLNKNSDLVFNFELDSASVAINAADLNYSVALPYDLKGVYRLNDKGPDIGCYEWQTKTEK